MEKISEQHSFYQHLLSGSIEELSRVRSLIYRISTLRLLLFLAGVLACVYFWGYGWMWLAGVACVTFVPFLALVKYHNSLFYRKEYCECKIRVNEQELSALKGDYSSFDDGVEYVDSSHLFSYDLDVFGSKSLFQQINRVTTTFGRHTLSGCLRTPLKKKEEILARQEALRELAGDPLFLQELRIAGLLSGTTSSDYQELQEWVEQPPFFGTRRMLRYLPVCAGVLNLLLWVLAVAGVIAYSIPGLAITLCVVLSFSFTQKITKTQLSFEKKWRILNAYARMLRLIEGREVQSKDLHALKKALYVDGIPASQALTRLSTLLSALDQRNNIFALLLLNGLFFWELWMVMRIENWKITHRTHLLPWLERVGDMEALASMAVFSYHHAECAWPSVADQPFVMEARAMGHPLMDRARCVKNDIAMTRRPSFMIVTGANMAGKSTYLRTVGVNYLLACAGMPVCADAMRFYPATMITGLRTNDSLSENESYFFAELKRLSMILERLKHGEEMFVILDEILRGTNSVDKQKGSMTLVRQFTELGANGILATHDLQLATLREAFPEAIDNYCFEAEICGGELTFSYRMQPGVAQNMNACFLMKKMGFDIS